MEWLECKSRIWVSFQMLMNNMVKHTLCSAALQHADTRPDKTQNVVFIELKHSYSKLIGMELTVKW